MTLKTRIDGALAGAIARSVAVFVLASCGDDGGVTVDAPVDAPADAPVDAPVCPITGRWVMTSVFCGPNDVTADVHAAGGLTEMRLDITDAAGACRMVGTFTGPTCTEIEERAFTIGGSGQLLHSSALGITSCQPAACTFNVNDAPCALGDRANDTGLTSAQLGATTIVVTNRAPSGMCQRFGLDTITTYTRT